MNAGEDHLWPNSSLANHQGYWLNQVWCQYKVNTKSNVYDSVTFFWLILPLEAVNNKYIKASKVCNF